MCYIYIYICIHIYTTHKQTYSGYTRRGHDTVGNPRRICVYIYIYIHTYTYHIYIYIYTYTCTLYMCSDFSTRVVRAYPLVEIRQTVPRRATRGKRSLSQQYPPPPLRHGIGRNGSCTTLGSGMRTTKEITSVAILAQVRGQGINIYIYIYVCKYVYIYIYIYIYISLSLSISLSLYIYIYVCVYTYIHVYTHILTYIYKAAGRRPLAAGRWTLDVDWALRWAVG